MKTSLLIKQLFGTILFFGIIFISAGRINYWQGIIYAAIGLIMIALNYTILRIDPELMKERSAPAKDSKKWDKLILGLSFLMTLAMFVIAGLDSGRFHWSDDFGLGLVIPGIVFTAVGQLLFLVAQKQNKFFSSTVRIQTDRGHVVYEGGLYRIVRHPAYMGSMIQLIGFPLLFGSVWSTIPVLLSLILLLMRTYLEDKTLKEELSGYADYTMKTRFRIIPYIW
ncbi:MAG: isoprenylcysteine carboxylmethyltransferase family protein [Bacteroidetes bacterium]|nr:isoprenylcysteine carboxylmethyltransferase family protein [Bacteroidota bacterium]